MEKKDWINIGILTLFLLLIVLIITNGGYYYGSTLDWSNQHFFIPEYFRTLFYDTFDLLPDYAFNLGSGQNIYYFAYYGLLNPFILISYLFPFIKMIDYIMISSILIVIIDIILLYKWLKSRKYNSSTCFIATMIFLCASPIIFHSHRHIMFVSYMPFILMALMGVDKYFKENKKWLLALSVFLIIMTNYFFSVGALVAIVIYGIFVYLEQKKLSLSEFLKEGFKFLYPIIIGILMASIILLPVFYTLLNGRDSTTQVDLINLLVPNFSFNTLTYSGYSMGLTAISLLFILNSLFKEKKYQFLAISLLLLLTMPITNYILNGTLYLNTKVFIPFIPLIILLSAESMKNISNFEYKKVLLAILLIVILSWFTDSFSRLSFYYDLAFSFILLIIFKYYKKIVYIAIIFVFAFSLKVNIEDELVLKDTIKDLGVTITDDSIYRTGNLIDSSLNVNNIYNINYNSTNLYSSVFNKKYNRFYFDVFNNPITYRNRSITSFSDNLLFNNYMGVKYIVSNYELGSDYTLIQKQDNSKLYLSNNSYPIGYITTETTNIEDYNKLNYPDNIYHIMKSAVVKDSKTTIDSKVKKIKLDYSIVTNNTDMQYKNGIYYFNIKDSSSMQVKTNISDDQILFIRFDMLYSEKCSVADTSITINGVKNKLTCSSWKYHNQNYTFDYLLYNNNDILNILFSKGRYEITNIKVYTLDKNELNQKIIPFAIDKNLTKGDNIVGTISAQDGYFILQVPYDLGYKIYLNGELTDYEEVNDGLIGFKIKKGDYEIKITYEAPYKKIGLAVSLFALVIFIFNAVKDGKNGKNFSNNTLL